MAGETKRLIIKHTTDRIRWIELKLTQWTGQLDSVIEKRISEQYDELAQVTYTTLLVCHTVAIRTDY